MMYKRLNCTEISQKEVTTFVGRAPVCRAGGRGFKPRPDQLRKSAAFVMAFANAVRLSSLLG